MSFGEVFRDLRKAHGLSQNDIATMFFVERASVGKWERGLNYPNQELLLNLADYFGVSLDYLFERSQKVTNTPKTEIQELFDELTPEQQKNLLNYARGMAVSNRLASSAIPKKKRA